MPSVDEIGKSIGNPNWDAYARSGMILDLHLTSKLSWDDAYSWAKELHAETVLGLLEGTYKPTDTRPPKNRDYDF